MCGIVGIVGTTEVAAALYDGLTVLQHRGQDAAGIATADGTQLRVHKGNGLVRDVFDAAAMAAARGPRRHRPLPLSDRRQRGHATRRSRSTSTRPTASRWRTTAT